jgi:YfiH family protein
MTTPFITHPLLDHARISHGFFGRRGGVSTGIYKSLNCGPGSNDDPENVRTNRHRIIAALGQGELVTLHQVHSPVVITVTEGFTGERPKADALVTATRGLILGILTADCGPVLFADAEARVIGAAHAGWKGAFTGVLENTVAAMEKLGATRSNIRAVIGPCIAQQSYEVGPEFVERLVKADAENQRFFIPSVKPDHSMFNLPNYVLARLLATGISNASAVRRDTCAEQEEFFSYRRTTLRGEPDYGRQISVISLK